MDKIQEKKFQILNDVCTSKDGLSWNELTEDLNELIEIAQKRNFKEFSGIFVDDNEIIPNKKYESFYLTIDINSVCAWNHGDNNTTTVDLQGGLRYRLDFEYSEFCKLILK